MADPSPRHPARRGMTVRAPPLGHRVLTYPWPPRPGCRVSAVRVPRIGREITSDPAPRQRRRVMTDPSPRHLARRGMTVRAPPYRRRFRTYPGRLQSGCRVLIARAPWPPPRRPPTAPMSCTRCRVPIAPIADPTPGHAQPPSPTPPRRPTTCMAGHIPPRRYNSSPKPTGRRCSMPRSACSRPLLSAPRPRGTLSRGASTTVGSALDVLRPLLEDRQALAPASKSAPFRLLDDAAHFTDDPTTCMTRKEHHPVICRYFIP